MTSKSPIRSFGRDLRIPQSGVWRRLAFAGLAALIVVGNAARPSGGAIDPAYMSTSQMSQQMLAAIKLFDEGQDTDAMDRFLDLLIHGEPAERPLANEYLNLIAQRMNVNETFQPLQRPAVSGPVPQQYPQSMQQPMQPPVYRPSIPAPDSSQRARNNIEQRIRLLKGTSLDAIKDLDGLRLVMADAINPRAIGIPVDLLFSQGVLFRKDAGRFLQSLTGLVYALGATQVVLLPEGFNLSDSKIIDMRRTMAVSSQLLAAGIAPPRIRVNLLQSQVDLPKAMADFRGIIILFMYDQPMPLKPEHLIAEQKGPPISLGVFPEVFRADAGQGALIEFSVAEPPAGLRSWRFQIMPPNYESKSFELAPIQQIVGSGAVFHQVYWNGRKGYWGDMFPEGRYEVLLTATDAKNRTDTLRSWVTLRGAKPPVVEAQQPAEQKSPRPHRRGKAGIHRAHKASRMAPAKSSDPGVEGKHVSAEPVAMSAHASDNSKEAASTQAASPDKGGDGKNSDNKNAFSYQIGFVSNTDKMTQDGEQRLAQAADAMGVYPLANLTVVGYANPAETDANALAGNRAQAVSSVLTGKYSVDPKRVTLQHKVTDAAQSQVEIFIVAAGKE